MGVYLYLSCYGDTYFSYYGDLHSYSEGDSYPYDENEPNSSGQGDSHPSGAEGDHFLFFVSSLNVQITGVELLLLGCIGVRLNVLR